MTVLLAGLAGVARAETVTQTYDYDAAGRLRSVTQDAMGVGYRYDPAGNLVEVPEPAAPLLALGAAAALGALSRRRRTRHAGLVLGLAFGVALAPAAGAHDCRHPVINLYVGSTFDDLLTVEADHHVLNTDYTVTVPLGQNTIVQVAPSAFASINSYLSVLAVAPGQAIIQTHWFYPGTFAFGDCFTTINVQTPPPDPTASNFPNSGHAGDPVNTKTGELTLREMSDLFVAGPMPLYFQRYYASNLRKFFVIARNGNNWRHNFDWNCAFVGNVLVVTTADGRVVRYLKTNTLTNEWTQQTALDEPLPVIQEILPTENHFHLFDPRKRMIYKFSVPPGDSRYRLVEIRDTHGNAHALSYSASNGDLVQVSDGLGRTLAFTYTAAGAATRKLASVGNGAQTVTFSYTGDDLTGVLDAAGESTQYIYAPPPVPGLVGLLERVVLPEGNSPLVNAWDLEGRVATQTNAAGDVTSFDYAPPTTTITDPRGNDAVQVHDANGNLTSAADASANTRTLGMDAAGRRNSVTYPLGGTSNFSFDAATGLEETVMTAEGRTAVYGYVMRNVAPGFTVKDLASIEFGDGRSESWTRDANGNPLTFTNRGGFTWTRTFNGRGQILTETNPKGGQWVFTYNPDATLLSVRDPALHLTSFAYDAVKRVVLVTRADGTTRSFGWDGRNRLTSITDEGGELTSFAFDGNGNLLSTTDALLHAAVQSYDDDDRVVTRTDRNGATTSYGYDDLGGVASATLSGVGTITWAWDDADQLAGMTLPDGTQLGFVADADGRLAESNNDLGQSEASLFDGDDRLVEHTDPGGRTTLFDYDEIGRVASRTEPDGKREEYAYAPTDQIAEVLLAPSNLAVGFSYDVIGSMTAAVDPNGETWSFEHDAQGRIANATDPLGNETTFTHNNRNWLSRADQPGGLGNVQLSYDGVGQVTRRLHSDGVDIVYTRDDLGRITALPGVTLGYDAESRITSSNGMSATRRPHGGELASVTLAPGKTVTYGFDGAGRVTSVTDWIAGTPAMTFSYDAAGQRTGATRANGVPSSWSYDGQGRLATVQHGALGSVAVTRDPVGRPTSVVRNLPLASLPSVANAAFDYDAASQVDTYSYDAMGRRTSDGTRTFTWDLATRLTSIVQGSATTALGWDGFGSLVSRTAGGTTRTFVWNYALAFPEIAIERQAGVDRRYFVHDPAGRLLYAVDAATNQRRFYHYDERSNTAFVTNGAGAVVASFAYSPYGDVASSGAEAADALFTFAGEYGGFALGNGLFVMHRRVYDAHTAAFLSREASFPHLHPLTINPYQYAARDPMRFFDPAGNDVQSPDAANQHGDGASGLVVAQNTVGGTLSTVGIVGAELGDHADEVAAAASRALGAGLSLDAEAGKVVDGMKGGVKAVFPVLETAEKYEKAFTELDARATKLANVADTLKAVGKVGDAFTAVDIGVALWTLFDKSLKANAFRNELEISLYRSYITRSATAWEIYKRGKKSDEWLKSMLSMARLELQQQLLWTDVLDGIDFQINFWTAVGDIYGAFVPGFGLVGTEGVANAAHQHVWSKVYGN